MNVILTSDFPSRPHPSVVAKILEAAASPRVAWIAPVSEFRGVRLLAAQQSFRSLGVPALEGIEIEGVTAAPPLTGAFDVVYLSGGDPILFRHNLSASGLDRRVAEFVASRGLVVAASGGAMQLTPNLSLYRLISEDAPRVVAERASHLGSGLLGVEFLPHLNRHDARFLSRVEEYSAAVDTAILALEDGGALIWSDGVLQPSLGCAVRYRRGISEQF